MKDPRERLQDILEAEREISYLKCKIETILRELGAPE